MKNRVERQTIRPGRGEIFNINSRIILYNKMKRNNGTKYYNHEYTVYQQRNKFLPGRILPANFDDTTPEEFSPNLSAVVQSLNPSDDNVPK